MFANTDGRKSVDSLSPMTPHTHRSDFPFHRQGSATGFPRQRRESVASSIHSIGGSLDTVPGSWASAVLESGQNAISTLLQPPIVRTGLLPHTSAPASSAHKPPTAKDIPPVALTNIPHVDAAEFAPYLTQVGALYEQLRRAKENDEEGTDGAQRRGSKPDDVADLLDEGHLKPGRRPSSTRKASISSISSLSALEMPGPLRRSSSSFIRKTTQGPPPLSTIPNVYFDDGFHLENPRTFDIVSERSEVVRPTPGSIEEKQVANGKTTAPRKALATNAILQEKLSWYMDTVEMHLISSISTASSTFFTALGSLKELHTEAAESVEKIRALRTELENLDDEIATRGLDIVQRRRKRENLQQLHDAVLQLRAIIEKVAVCESLVDEGELEKALDDVDSLERLIAGEVDTPVVFGQKSLQKPRIRDLRGATALQGVNEDIETLRFRVGKAYEAKLVTALMADVRRHVDNVSSREVLMRWSSASLRARGGHAREPSTFPSYLTATDDLRSELTPILHGLHRSRYLGQATLSYRESLLREIRNLIKRPLPSSNDDDNESMMSSSTTGRGQRSQQDKGSILARNLRALEPEDAEELLVKVYIGVTETLRRLSTQAKVLLDVASSIGEDSEPEGLKSPQIRSPPISPGGRRMSIAAIEAQEELHKALDLSNLVGQAVDVAQDRVVRLLRARAEQSTHLSLICFLRYFTLNLHFANECEAISGRSGTTLKNVVNGHIRGFVQQHGDTEKQKLAQGMESDQWDAKDFDEKHSELLGRVLKSSTKDDETWSDGTKVWIPYSDVDSGNEENDENGEADDPAQPNGTAKAKARGAVIEEETFLLPKSAILCLDGMSQFLRLMVSMPSMTPDISVSLISYLQLFNSRCTQLILGAGATRSAGLKNITTKHLALASQALGFIVTLIPHIRELARRHAGAGPPVANLMGEFDKVKRGYQEHQNNIYDKLVEIMSGRAVAHSKAMKTITWDKPDSAAHPYMNTLVKETSMLQRNLTKTLPEHRVLMIMVPVFNSYKEHFGKAFQAAEVGTEAGRKSMLQDVDFFIAKLGKVDGFGDTGDYLKSIINSREIEAPAPDPTPDPAPTPAPAPAAIDSSASPAGSARPSGEGDQAPAETTTTPDETKEEEKEEAAAMPKDG